MRGLIADIDAAARTDDGDACTGRQRVVVIDRRHVVVGGRRRISHRRPIGYRRTIGRDRGWIVSGPVILVRVVVPVSRRHEDAELLERGRRAVTEIAVLLARGCGSGQERAAANEREN